MERSMNVNNSGRRVPGLQRQALKTECSSPGDRVVEVCLAPRQAFTLQGDHRGVRLTALQGTLWVTQQGDAQDYLLRPGEAFTITRPGTVVVQGMREARLGYHRA